MGNNARIKAQRNRFKKGDLIQLVQPVGFLPAGLYVYEGRMGNLVQLSAGDVLAGIDLSFLDDCVPLTAGKKTTLRIPTEQEFEEHHKHWLEAHRAESTTVDGCFETTPLSLSPENARELGLPKWLHTDLPGKTIN